jgi:A/G-specific adenine glycosylase
MSFLDREQIKKKILMLLLCIYKPIFSDFQVKSLLEYNEKVSFINYHTSICILSFGSCVKGIVENGIDLKTLKTFPFLIVIHNFIEKEYRV